MSKIYRFKTILWDTMKISLLHCCIAVIFSGLAFGNDRLHAQELLEKRISVTMEGKSLKLVLSAIEQHADIRFIYNPNEIKPSSRVSIKASGERLSGVLNSLLTPLSIRYEVKGKYLMLFRDSEKPGQEKIPAGETGSSYQPTKH